MIAAANPLAEQSVWRSANSLRAYILAEYHAMIPAVIQHLKKARSLIHISFDNWTTYGGKRALTGICVHHLNEHGEVEDYVLGLPQLHGCHSGESIAHVVSEILQIFEIDETRLGYFVLDNATNNDTAIEALADMYNFWAPHRRLRCTCHILNLSAQLVIWGKDREAFENENLNIQEEEAFLGEWRKYGPIGVLFDIIASICTAQTRELFERLQVEEAKRLNKSTEIYELIRPVRTRWNSYFLAMQRAALLHGPIDDYTHIKMEEIRLESASQRRNTQSRRAEPRIYVQEGGLTAKDWATINEYIRLLAPFLEATKLLEGRGNVGRHGAIWEVVITFEWLLDELEEQKDRLSQVDYNHPDAPEDHLKINVNLAHAKLSEYYRKFDDSPIYYTATILHPHYKLHLEALWGVPDNYDEEKDGPHHKKDWLPNNNKGFIKLYRSYKEKLAVEAG